MGGEERRRLALVDEGIGSLGEHPQHVLARVLMGVRSEQQGGLQANKPINYRGKLEVN